MDGRSCQQCAYFEAIGEKRESGACHRFPPRTVVFPDENGESDIKGSVWPLVPAAQWCGEFRGCN